MGAFYFAPAAVAVAKPAQPGTELALWSAVKKTPGGVFGYVMLPHAGDRGAVRHFCFSILRIVARLGSQCSSERDQKLELWHKLISLADGSKANVVELRCIPKTRRIDR